MSRERRERSETNADLISDLVEALNEVDLMFARKNLSDAELDWMGDDEHSAWSAAQRAIAKAKKMGY